MAPLRTLSNFFSDINAAERGVQACGSTGYGEIPRFLSRFGTWGRSMSSTAEEQGTPEDLAELHGEYGLAILKARDSGLAFYSCYPIAINNALTNREREVKHLIDKLSRIEKRIVARYKMEPHSLPSRNKDKKLWAKQRKATDQALFSFLNMFQTASAVLGSDEPHKLAVEEIEEYVQKKAPTHRQVFDDAAFGDFRVLVKRDSFEDFVKSLPRSSIGEKALRFLRSGKFTSEEIEYQVFSDHWLAYFGGTVMILTSSFFFLFPLAVIAYRAVGKTASLSIMFVLCLLACLSVRFIAKQASLQLLLVLAYGSVIVDLVASVL